MENLIEVRDLRKTYPLFTLQDLSFDLPAGVIMGCIGENGAGKSTTIKLILDLVHRDGGTVRLLGHEPAAMPLPLKEEIGVVFEDCNIPEMFNARDVEKVMRAAYRNWQPEVYAAWLQRFELPPKQSIKTYSRGMKVKLMLAIALSHQARLLILDEATSGLDPVIRDELLEVFQEFIQDEGHSVFISSHILSDLEKVCDWVLFIHKGRLEMLETRDGLREKYGLWQGSPAELAQLPPQAVVGTQASPYAVSALVRRELLPPGTVLEPVSMEEIMLYVIRKGK